MAHTASNKVAHKLTNNRTHPVTIILEPWGGEYDHGPGDSFDLMVEGDVGAPLEFEFNGDDMTITSDGPHLGIAREGKFLPAR